VADADYRPNPAGLAAMLAAPFMVAEMKRRAELGRIEAERIAPVDTGAYAFDTPNSKGAHGGGFKVTAGIKDGRAYARLSNHVRAKPSKNFPDGYGYGWALEHGNKRIKKQRILGRAIDALSGKA
jgi:hypothetical protein